MSVERTWRVCVELGRHLKEAVGQIGAKEAFRQFDSEPLLCPSVSGVAFVMPGVSALQSCGEIYVFEGQSKEQVSCSEFGGIFVHPQKSRVRV